MSEHDHVPHLSRSKQAGELTILCQPVIHFCPFFCFNWFDFILSTMEQSPAAGLAPGAVATAAASAGAMASDDKGAKKPKAEVSVDTTSDWAAQVKAEGTLAPKIAPRKS
jgi:hypothetical protein